MATSGGVGALDLKVLISAQNTASAEFQKVQKDATDTAKVLQDAGKTIGSAGMQDLAKQTEATGKSLREVIGPLKLFSGSIASELNPSLGNLVFSLGAASREARTFSLTTATMIIGVASAGTIMAVLIQRLKETSAAQNELNFAAKGFDAQALSSQIESMVKAADAFKKFNEDVAGGFFGKLLDLTRTPGAFNILDKLFGRPDPALLEEAKQLYALVQPFQEKIAQNQQLAAMRQAEAGLEQFKAARAEQMADMELFIALEGRSAAAIDLESVALQNNIAMEAELERIRARRKGTLAIDEPGITNREQIRMHAENLRSDTRQRALEFATREGQLNIQGITEAVVAEPRAIDEVTEGFGIGQTAIRDIRRQKASDDAELTAVRAQGQTQLVGLTRQQRVEMELISIEAARHLAITQAEGKENQGQLAAMANLSAEMKAQALIQQEMAAQNPLKGFALGMSQVVDEFTAAGELMRSGIHQLGNDMSRSFSDTFTAVIMGDFKKIADLPTAFAKNMLAAFSDMVGKMVIGNLFGNIQRSFGGGFGSVLPSAGMLAGGGGGGGGDLIQLGGQLFQQVTAGGGQTVLVPLGGAGAGTAGGGGFSFANMPNISLPPGTGSSLFAGTNIGAMWNAPISALFSSDVVFSGGQLISNAGELAGVGLTSAGIAGEAGLASAGVSLSMAASGIAGAIGLGLTIFSALQGPPTFQNIAISTISGAASGAAAGALIGSIWPGVGNVIGAIVGAIAGAAGGGLAASFGKGGLAKPPSPAERSYQAALAGRANLSGAIDAASGLEQMVQILNTRWSPFNEINILAYDIPTHWTGSGYTNGTPHGVLAMVKGNGEGGPPFPDIATMLADPRYIDNLEIQVAGPAGGGSAAYDPTVTTKFQDKWNSLVLALAKGKFGFREDFGPLMDVIGAAPSATGTASVERLSVLSGSQLFGRGRGQQLEISPDVLKTQGLTDDQIEQFLRLAVQVDKDRNLNILVRPEQFAF